MALRPNIPPIRYRSPTGLRHLGSTDDLRTLFAASDARHDRINAQLIVMVACHADDLEDVVGFIDTRAGTLDPHPILECDWINRGDKLRVRTAPGWLFNATGNGAIRPHRDGHALTFSLSVSLNPTRFLAHQPDPELSAMLARSPFEALRVDPTTRDALRGSTLDGNDNLLSGRSFAGGTTFGPRRRDWWAGILRTYIGKIEALLLPLFAADGRSQVLRFDWAGISDAEVYWDLETADAVAWARSFQIAGMTSHHAAVENHALPQCGGQANVRWLSLSLPNGVKVKAYAKTDRRVRFEVSFSKRVGQEANRHANGDRTFVGKLLALTQSAEPRMARAFEPIIERMAPHPPAAELVDFLLRINSAVPDVARAQLLRLLINHRALVPSPQIPISVCEALCRTGILRRSRVAHRDSPQFDIAPEYGALVQELLGGDPAA
jgi:hypothetical protein